MGCLFCGFYGCSARCDRRLAVFGGLWLGCCVVGVEFWIGHGEGVDGGCRRGLR